MQIKRYLILFLISLSSVVFAQNGNQMIGIIMPIENQMIPMQGSAPVIKASKYRLYEIDISALSAKMAPALKQAYQPGTSEPIIELPFPDGTWHTYRVIKNDTLDPRLAAKYPEITTFDGISTSNPEERVKLDITPKGFHAMVLLPGKSPVFIDPYIADNSRYYMVYNKNAFTTTKKMTCHFQNHFKATAAAMVPNTNYSSCEKRKYRLALAATAQYTQFAGGRKVLALSAQTTTMNRVNGIYQRDLGITMQIIADNTKIIYTNPSTQPYTSGNIDAMIDQNQTNINNVIGAANYDIGHLFDAADTGGLAGLGVICANSQKAWGVTGTDNPIGDPFDVDYVAHEMGHQFGANHTQNNNCNRNNPTAMEPGSGSTIMSYAGICAPNIQAHSSAYFHGVNLEEIGTLITSPGHLCAQNTPLTEAPTITSTNGNTTIPANTPFSLIAKADNGSSVDKILFNWEQMDNQITSQPPKKTATGGPNFRSLTPVTSPVRFFPNLTSLANNGPYTWEVTPSVSRVMKFRVTARSNHLLGSCNSYKDVTVTTYAGAGPFVVTYPTTTGIIWSINSSKNIKWQVANTNVSPVNAQKVDILLSTNGGISFPYILVAGIPNDGVATIVVPNRPTTKGRIMVRASGGRFFNISTHNFEIRP